MAKVKISELPSLSPATLDTTYVVGISGSTTYKISINQLTSSLDTTFATDLVTAALSSSLDGKLSTSSYSNDSASFNSRIISGSAVAGTISGSAQISALGFLSTSTDLSSLNTISASYLSFTQSYYSASASFDSRVDSLENATSSYLTSLNGAISGAGQISDLGFVTGSYTTLNSFNNLTQSFNSISQSFTTISGSFGDIDFSGINAVTESYLLFTQSYYSASASFDDRITDLQNATSSYLTSLNGALSSSAQVLDGSGIFSSSAQLPNGLLSSSLGFVSTASYTTDSASFNSRIISGSAVAGTISGSAQITAFGFISSSQTINTSSFATTGSNSFNGNQTITGSLVVSAVAVVNGGITIPTGSVISLTSGSSLFVDISGSITGSLTGSVFGIGDVVAFSASVNNRILSGSAVAGTVSGSSQLTSSFDTRYAISASFVSSSNLSSIRTITSASYAALTPVSGTLYIIIG